MIKKRIIPKILLDSMSNGSIAAGMTSSYDNFIPIGSPISQAKILQDNLCDEIFVCKRNDKISLDLCYELIEEMAAEIFSPISFGGNIQTIEEISNLVTCGIEQVVIGRSATLEGDLIRKASNKFGKQFIIYSIDYRKTSDGRFRLKHTNELFDTKNLIKFILAIVQLGAGQLLLCNMDRDGSTIGPDLELLKILNSTVSVPIIIGTGIRTVSDFIDAYKNGADAVAAGSFFCKKDTSPLQLRSHIWNEGIDIRH